MAVTHSDTISSHVDNPTTGVSKNDWTADHLGLGPWLPKITGRYLAGPSFVNTGAAPTLNRLNYAGAMVPAGTIDRIGVWITAGGTAGSVVRLGLYDTDTSTGDPGSLLVDGGTVDTTGTGFKEVTVSTTVTAGLLWIAAVAQVAVPDWIHTGSYPCIWISETTPTNFIPGGYGEAGVSGSLPSSATPVGQGTGGNNFRYWIRFSA